MNDTQAADADVPAPADTTATQPSEASTTSNEAPEANQATEVSETSTTDVKAEDTAGEKLFAGKYKTPEEMEKAYLGLQSKSTKDSQEKAELTRILNEAFQTPAPAQAPAATEESFTEEPDPVNLKLQQLERVTAVQSFIMSHSDANPTAMQKILADDPLVKQIQGHDAKLEYAYLRSQNMTQTKAIEEAKQSGATQATAKIAEKQAAQVESARRSEQVDEKSELKNRMATGSQAERDAARSQYIRKYLVNL